MKKTSLIFTFLCLTALCFGQQLPDVRQTHAGQVLSNWSERAVKSFTPPSGTTPSFPAWVADTSKCGAFFYVVNPGVDTSLYTYNCLSATWVKVGGSGSGVSLANNGLTDSANYVQLGGSLTNDVTIDALSHGFSIAGEGSSGHNIAFGFYNGKTIDIKAYTSGLPSTHIGVSSDPGLTYSLDVGQYDTGSSNFTGIGMFPGNKRLYVEDQNSHVGIVADSTNIDTAYFRGYTYVTANWVLAHAGGAGGTVSQAGWGLAINTDTVRLGSPTFGLNSYRTVTIPSGNTLRFLASAGAGGQIIFAAQNSNLIVSNNQIGWVTGGSNPGNTFFNLSSVASATPIGIGVNASVGQIGFTVDTLNGFVFQDSQKLKGASNAGYYEHNFTDLSLTTVHWVDSVLAALPGGGTTTHPLTLGTGLLGTPFDGSAAVTAKLDTSVAQTVLNFFPKGDTRYYKASNPSGFISAAVTSIATSTGILGGTITGTGTLKADTTVLQTVLNFFPKADTRYPTFASIGSNYYSKTGSDARFVQINSDATLNSLITTIKPASVYQTGTGTAGTDSLVVKNSGGLKAISASYYQIAGSYLSSAVTSVATSTGILGGTITGTGTLKADTSVLQTVLNFFPKGDTRYYKSTNPSGYITGITSSNVTTALGYTPLSASNFVKNETPSGTVNGSNVTFALANTPSSGTLALFQNGLLLSNITDFTISSATITFVTAPTTGDILLAAYSK